MKSWRPSLKRSAQDLRVWSGAETPRRPSPLLELECSQVPPREHHLQTSSIWRGKGSFWWTSSGSWCSLVTLQSPPCNQTWCPDFWFLQTGRTTGADSAKGRLLGGSLWKEALEVHRNGQRLPAGWLESKVSPSQSGLQSPQHFLGIAGERKQRAVHRASRWLWLKRGDPWGQNS